jgi:molybdenum cofactor synthesis domain-containing protein
MTPLVAIRDTPLDSLEVERAVAHSGAGAVVSFVGRVRDYNDGMTITRLEYEAYPSMATQEMLRIVGDIEQRLPGTRLAVLHRIGTLDVGDAAIICAASAAHRSDAFAACRLLIDEVKASVPIWKREHGPDGPYWVGWEDARCTGDHGSHHEHDQQHCHHHHQAEAGTAGLPLVDWNVVCITVSDTRSLETDQSGAAAQQLLATAGARVERRLVHDDATAIAQAVGQCLAFAPHSIVLTGGTGIGPRDVTYEALFPMLERQLDGFGEAFRRLSFDTIGSRAILSRAIAGTIGATAVFAVPGSPKAVTLALERLIIPLLPHARAMLEGGGH